MTPEYCAVIPVRSLPSTKFRLSKLLDEESRGLLTRALLSRVLLATQASALDRIVLVTSNPNEILPRTAEHSKLAVISETLIRGGVNQAMIDGIQFSLVTEKKRQSPRKYLLMPSDLPFLDSTTVNKIIKLTESYDLIINPSRKRDGTSLLAFDSEKAIPFHYDDNSFVKHVMEAKRLNRKYLVTEFRAFSFDVDNEEDLKLLMKEMNASTFGALIEALTPKRGRT